MKPLFASVAALAVGAMLLSPVAAQEDATNNATNNAAMEGPMPRQYVVVVAEGVSPQLLELTRGYLRKADDDAELVTAFDQLKNEGQSPAVGANSLAEMKGLLLLAENSGFKTGLVTTADLTIVAPLFYDLNGDAATALARAEAQYDFLGGAGGEKLTGAGAALKAAGGTYIAKVEDLDAEITGRVLATREGDSFSYALDRDPASEIGLSEMAALAVDTLSIDNSPFVLVVHDTKLKDALQRQDSPAVFEQMREINTVIADALARREDNANFAVAALMTGGNVLPAFKAGTDAENSYFILANLTRSYAGAGLFLKGATAEEISEFADVETGEYRGWNVSDADKARIEGGELDAETAIRASYAPAVGLEFTTKDVAPVAFSIGLDAAPDLNAALKAAVAVRP